jgi:hypothetical protein
MPLERERLPLLKSMGRRRLGDSGPACSGPPPSHFPRTNLLMSSRAYLGLPSGKCGETDLKERREQALAPAVSSEDRSPTVTGRLPVLTLAAAQEEEQMEPQTYPQNNTVADRMSFKLGAWLIRWNETTQDWHGQHERRATKPVKGAHEILTTMLNHAQAARRQEPRDGNGRA